MTCGKQEAETFIFFYKREIVYLKFGSARTGRNQRNSRRVSSCIFKQFLVDGQERYNIT